MPGSVDAKILAELASKGTAGSPLAGKRAPRKALVGVTRLQHEYFERSPDAEDPKQLISFGTSGHRCSPPDGSFTEAHILAITQAICDYRRSHGVNGPLLMGKDTHGAALYTRIDAPATPDPEDVRESELAGEPIIDKLTRAPGNGAPIGGLKVVTPSGWFAARPSGTENLYKIYAESFKGESHLGVLVNEAQQIVNNALL